MHTIFSNPTATARAAAARNPRPRAFRPRRAGAAQTSNSTMLSFPLKTVPTGVEGSWDSEEVVDGLRKLLSSQYGDAAARGLAGALGVLRRARTASSCGSSCPAARRRRPPSRLAAAAATTSTAARRSAG